MDDPHVEMLVYDLVVDEDTSFVDPPALTACADGFDLVLEDGCLQVIMKEHFASPDEARHQVDPYLDSWVTYCELHGQGGFRFKCRTAEVVDRDPPPPGSAKVAFSGRAVVSARSAITVRGRAGRRSYPPPPTSFVADPDVQTMWMRYKGYKQGKEPITAMAYFCYTMACTRGGGRAGTTVLLNIDGEVLDALSKISAEFGGPTEARKVVPKRNQLLTPQHRQWLENTVKELILRMGRVAAGKTNPDRLEMKDLPSIPKP